MQLFNVTAEPLNTITNLSFLYLAFKGFSTQSEMNEVSLLFLSCGLIGIGSACFHGTLTRWGQTADELAMIVEVALYIYVLYDVDNASLIATSLYISLTALCIFAYLHLDIPPLAFQTAYGLLVAFVAVSCMVRLRPFILSSRERQTMAQCIASGFVGSLFWLIDYHQCGLFDDLNVYPIGHALWHLLTSYCCYLSICSLQILKEKESVYHKLRRSRFG